MHIFLDASHNIMYTQNMPTMTKPPATVAANIPHTTPTHDELVTEAGRWDAYAQECRRKARVIAHREADRADAWTREAGRADAMAAKAWGMAGDRETIQEIAEQVGGC